MKTLCWLFAALLSATAVAQDAQGPYARIAVLRPHDGKTVEFEAGYRRHLDWHVKAKDTWAWYGWTVWAGDRQRWFVYATFGHAAADFDAPVLPAEDERDNIANVTPHAEFVGNVLYEFLPRLSRGNGVPTPTPRVELTTVELKPGAEAAFEAALSAEASNLAAETLWYRMRAGGDAPRYVRLRPRPNLAALLADDSPLPARANASIEKSIIEILNLRPALSFGIEPHP